MNWNDRYRPKTFDELTGDREIHQSIRAMVMSADIPHLLFYGAPGSGKTTMAEVICRIICGEYPHPNFIEINASDDRGIDKIRNIVQRATRNMSLDGGVKIVFFDECDGLTRDAQELLRRPIEKSRDVLFIFACNDMVQVIPAIKSRCAQYNFDLTKEHIIQRLKHIVTAEGLELDDFVYDEIAQKASITPKGQISPSYDMRTAINELQKRVALFNLHDSDQQVAEYLKKVIATN